MEATADVGVWLGNLGLGQYQAAFRENAIDGDVLLRLNPDDLKDLGVTIVGHRRKLLDAIAVPELLAAPQGPSVPLASTPAQKAAGVAAERRPVTVMSGRFDTARVAARRRGLAQSG